MIEDVRDELRQAALSDFATFIELVHPRRVLGSIHRELAHWITRPEAKKHKLVLLPRDHGKSAMAAYYAAWRITKNPAIRILYISSTANLATKQLKFIKDILTADNYRLFWPEMVNIDEQKREKWSETEISVDHPLRKYENVRDPTVFTAGLTTSVTGLHCDLIIPDDVVVYENAYTEEGRDKVALLYSLLASIQGADAEELVVGTRYHPLDQYNTLLSKKLTKYNKDGSILSEEPLYEIFEKQVETLGDGTGEFLWPRQQAKDGRWFGFDQEILATKRSLYTDQTQFRAQYYNDPNGGDNEAIPREHFQYYDRGFIRKDGDHWYYRDRRLNVFAAIDFAYTKKKASDFSAIVVVGVDYQNNYYVLDIDRFKSDLPSEYFDKILLMHNKWDFRKIKAECTAAQQVIVNDIKVNYIRPYGLSLFVEEFKPSKYQGAKEERIAAVLQPRYANGQVWHYFGGHCQTLEEELVRQFPPHDDLKDCLTTAIDGCIAPSNINQSQFTHGRELSYNQRFGGFNG